MNPANIIMTTKIMKKIFAFILSASFFIACNTAAQKTVLNADEFEQGIAKGNVQVLDVRTAGEYSSGHLANSLQADWTRKDEFYKRVASLDKSKPVYTYCLSGGRSNAAMEWLNANGYTAYNLAGGINGWKRAGKAVEQAVQAPQITMVEYLSKIPKDKTVLVDIGAAWCPPCKKMNPVIDSLAAKRSNDFILVKIDGATQTDLCTQLNATEFPTFIIYKNGAEVWRKTGEMPAEEIVKQF